MATEVIMPSLGESVHEGTIASWLKNEGDTVRQYEALLEIETDKVTTETTAEVAGTLLMIMVREGETVPVGTVLAYLGSPEEKADLEVESGEGEPSMSEIPFESPQIRPEEDPRSVSTPSVLSTPSRSPARRYTGRISPVVGRIAGEHGVDLKYVPGTGLGGRITKKDILAYIEKQQTGHFSPQIATIGTGDGSLSPEPMSEGAVYEGLVPDEIVPLNNMRRSIAAHMVRSKQTSPHVTTVFDIDFTLVAANRSENKEQFARSGAKLTFTAYIVAAIAQALKAHPLVNSSWTEQGIAIRNEINVGIAAAIPDGLIVPVIKNTDKVNLLGLSKIINDYAHRARSGLLLPDEVQGGTFTLTNHGISGSLFATPIINQPQCGILGIGKIEKRVKVIDDGIAIRMMAYASLTFDHRILDGATADHFMITFKKTLEEWS